jgi:hypothetical protein
MSALNTPRTYKDLLSEGRTTSAIEDNHLFPVWDESKNGGLGGVAVIRGLHMKSELNDTSDIRNQTAFVSTTGDDATASVGDETKPFDTITAALTAVNSINNGIVYVKTGSYTENVEVPQGVSGNPYTKKKHLYFESGTTVNGNWTSASGGTNQGQEFHIYGKVSLIAAAGDLFSFAAVGNNNVLHFYDTNTLEATGGDVFVNTYVGNILNAGSLIASDYIFGPNGRAMTSSTALNEFETKPEFKAKKISCTNFIYGQNSQVYWKFHHIDSFSCARFINNEGASGARNDISDAEFDNVKFSISNTFGDAYTGRIGRFHDCIFDVSSNNALFNLVRGSGVTDGTGLFARLWNCEVNLTDNTDYAIMSSDAKDVIISGVYCNGEIQDELINNIFVQPAQIREKELQFASNLDLIRETSFTGSLNISAVVLTAGLASVAYSVSSDDGATFTSQADIAAVNTWIDSNISGDESTGTKWRLRVTATYNASIVNMQSATIVYNR